MASKNFSDWRSEVEKYVKGVDSTPADQIILDAEIKETIRDFCENTHLWSTALDRISIVADTSDYTLSLPTSDGKSELEIVESVLYKVDGADDDQFRSLIPAPADWQDDSPDTGLNYTRLNSSPGQWRFVTAPEPTNYLVSTSNVLKLVPIPTVKSDSGLLVRVVLKPADDATKCPDWIYNQWKVAITWGTAGRLLSMTTKKWFDATLGAYFTGKYEARRLSAALKKTTGFTRRPLQVSSPFFAGSRSRIQWTG